MFVHEQSFSTIGAAAGAVQGYAGALLQTVIADAPAGRSMPMLMFLGLTVHCAAPMTVLFTTQWTSVVTLCVKESGHCALISAQNAECVHTTNRTLRTLIIYPKSHFLVSIENRRELDGRNGLGKLNKASIETRPV